MKDTPDGRRENGDQSRGAGCPGGAGASEGECLVPRSSRSGPYA